MSGETESQKSIAKTCAGCGSAIVTFANYCSACGASLRSFKNLDRCGSLLFKSRWLVLVVFISSVVANINFFLSDIVLIAYISFLVFHNKLSLKALLGRIPSNYNWWLVLLVGIACLTFSVGASIVVMYLIAQLNSEFVNDLLSENPFSEDPVSLFFLLVIFAPLLEETVFRGLFFSRVSKKWGITTGIIVSSLVFGLLHPINPIGALIFGITACVVYVETRTLWTSISIHSLNNLIVWILMFAEENSDMTQVSSEFLGEYLYQGYIAMLVGGLIISILLKRWWPVKGSYIPYQANLMSTDV